MSRPLRVEFPGAWYHVMNRGIGGQDVFLDTGHRKLFLTLLDELLARFGIETHAYCLMDNHYHLLLRTPEGNLNGGMRHLNGVYTQRFNRDQQREGPLFRGRYKAILVDRDNYLMQVSRYIHRNPLDAGIADQLDRYRWSSYRFYVRPLRPEPWLHCNAILETVGGRKARYRAFVEQSIDEELAEFYRKQRQAPILGSQDFVLRIAERLNVHHTELADVRRVLPTPTAQQIVSSVATEFGLDKRALLSGRRPHGELTVARNLGMLLCQSRGRMTLSEIARLFRLGHYTSVATAIGECKRRLGQDRRLRRYLDNIHTHLDTAVDSNK